MKIANIYWNYIFHLRKVINQFTLKANYIIINFANAEINICIFIIIIIQPNETLENHLYQARCKLCLDIFSVTAVFISITTLK